MGGRFRSRPRSDPFFGARTILELPQIATTQLHAAGMLHRLWAYITLAATGIVTEEATPLIGGLAAHDGRLRFTLVGLWISGGTWVGDIALYYVGRWRGKWVRRRFPRLRRFLVQTFRIVRRHPWRASLAVRWAYGLRLTLPIACGAAHVPILIYAIGAAVSCITWSFGFALLGWGFGRTTLILLGHVRRYEKFLVAAILIAIAVVFWLMRKRHVEDEVVVVLASGDTGPIPKVSLEDDNTGA
jgi:membrane protein DedA with SNARE-associated domain